MSLKSLVKSRRDREDQRLQDAAQGLLKLSTHSKVNYNSTTIFPVYPYFPDLKSCSASYSFKNGFHTGEITVHCNLSSKKYHLSCIDYGQYPWGRNRQKGTMAWVCKQLNINTTARNTCLPLHILIGLLHKRILCPQDLTQTHKTFVKNMLSSKYPRTYSRTIKAFLKQFKISNKVCFRSIVFVQKNFILLNEFDGSSISQPIFICHHTNHFFLGIANDTKKT